MMPSLSVGASPVMGSIMHMCIWGYALCGMWWVAGRSPQTLSNIICNISWPVKAARHICVACRMQILDCHNLNREHFDSMKEFLETADAMVSGLKARCPGIAAEHPDILVPGVPMLDRFWYFKDEGTIASLRASHTHMRQLPMHLPIYTYMKL